MVNSWKHKVLLVKWFWTINKQKNHKLTALILVNIFSSIISCTNYCKLPKYINVCFISFPFIIVNWRLFFISIKFYVTVYSLHFEFTEVAFVNSGQTYLPRGTIQYNTINRIILYLFSLTGKEYHKGINFSSPSCHPGGNPWPPEAGLLLIRCQPWLGFAAHILVPEADLLTLPAILRCRWALWQAVPLLLSYS
jgi:hypothetical protein